MGLFDFLSSYSYLLILILIDPPGPPVKLAIADWDRDYVDLTWEVPKDDGGSPITHYIVECKEHLKDKWLPCHKTENAAGLAARVKEIIRENSSYSFRVRAVNAAGEGKPSAPTESIAIKAKFVKPFIVGDAMKDVVVKCGQIISWNVKFGGEPGPSVQWLKNDKELVGGDGESGKISIETVSKNTTLTIKNCLRSDTAKYKVVLTNSSGTATASADGVVLGKPSLPEGPLEVTNVRAKKAVLNWKKPKDDGGSPITYYALEKMDLESGRWVPCGEAPGDQESAPVTGLTPGKKYKFRVRAVNKEGQSEPLESSDAIEAKNPYREPDPPLRPVIYDWDNQSVTLRWEKPNFDGGRPITHYVIEQKGKFDVDFIEVATSNDTFNLETTLQGLREKSIFEWRIRAVNKAGPSLPSQTTPKHLVKHRNRKNYDYFRKITCLTIIPV